MKKLPAVTPAPYSTQLIEPLIEEIGAAELRRGAILLDPFAGLGQVLAVIAHRLGLVPLGFEIEPGYHALKKAHRCVIIADSTKMSLPDCSIDAAVTSPAYPNGVSDSFHANDASVRHTYVHRLRAHLGPDYELQPNNAGGMNPRRSPAALNEFYTIHCKVWAEVFRVLKPGALFVVNTKDTTAVRFWEDTCAQLLEEGFLLVRHRQIDVPGLNHGKNREQKLTWEDVTTFRKP